MTRQYPDPEAPEVLEAVIERMRQMTDDEWRAEFAWRPEGARETHRTREQIMGLLEDFVRRNLGDISNEAKRRLILDLENLGKEFLVPHLADTVSRAVVKSTDGVAATAARSLEMEDDAARLVAAYVEEVTDQLDQLAAALVEYAPHALAVEVAKKAHGGKSAQANAARREREKWMQELRGEVRDCFRSIAGQEAVD